MCGVRHNIRRIDIGGIDFDSEIALIVCSGIDGFVFSKRMDMEGEKTQDRATISVSIDRKVEQSFRAYCKRKRFIMSRIAEDLLREWLEKEGVSIDQPPTPKEG